MNCLVKDCPNESGQGTGKTILIDHPFKNDERWICISCWETVIEGTNENSQVHRNCTSYHGNTK